MAPEESAHPERDEPLARPAYPYDRPALDASAGAGPLGNSIDLRPLAIFLRGLMTHSEAQYKVPQRFGMSAILGIMTALAFLFGGLRLLNADPLVYLFFGLQGLVICVAQMFQGQMPRFASSAAGAVILPVFVMFAMAFSRYEPPFLAIACTMVISVPVGAFLGYLIGTCAAGIFLVMDALEPYLQGQRPASSSSAVGR